MSGEAKQVNPTRSINSQDRIITLIRMTLVKSRNASKDVEEPSRRRIKTASTSLLGNCVI